MTDPKSGAGPPRASLSQTTISWSTQDLPEAWATVEVSVVDPGRYSIVREVARGGSGRILEAFDKRLDREVALKQLLRPEVGEARFIREAVLTARLQHPAIVPIYEVGVFSSGEPFIAMKLVRGQSLRDAIRARPAFAARLELISSVLAVCDAVAYAQSQRVIHRDLKPSNVLIGSFGETVVIDWGLAKHLDVVEPESPDKLAIVGTPAYMPPEQALGHNVDERADVYALGAMLYEVLTGHVPHRGDSSQEVLKKLLTARPPAVESHVPEVPAELAAIVRKAMMTAPSERYANAAELAVDLRRFYLGQAVSIRRPELPHDPRIEEDFQRELRVTTVAPLRLSCALAIVLIPTFALMVRLHLGRVERVGDGPRIFVFAGVALILAASYSERARRGVQTLGMLLVFLVGSLTIVLDVGERLEGLFTGIMLLSFIGLPTLLSLSPRRVSVVLVALLLEFVGTALATRLQPADWQFISELALFSAGSLFAIVIARMSYRIRRAEFYNRSRLQSANELLSRSHAR